jgi:excisionase family DNA binding protein
MLHLMSLPECSQEMKISIYTLRSWIYQKRIPIVKLGRRVLIKREDLEEFVNKSVIEAKS